MVIDLEKEVTIFVLKINSTLAALVGFRKETRSRIGKFLGQEA